MLQREVEIVNRLGLHARASAKLTQVAGQFKSDVWVSRNGRRVNAKSIMGVMMLAAAQGSTIVLETDGPDEARGHAGRQPAHRGAVRGRRDELHHPRHRRLRRDRDRPRAPRARTRSSRPRTTSFPRTRCPRNRARFDAAVESVRAELEEVRASIPATAPAEFSAFVNLHLMILNDSMLSVTPRKIIEEEQCNAEWALKVQMDELLARFDEIDDAYLRERKADVIQVVERVMKALAGQPGYIPPPPNADGEGNLILVARDLSPADVVQFKRHQFASFITDLGGVDLPHRGGRAQPQHPLDRRAAFRAPADPRGRSRDRGRHPGRGDRRSRPAGARPSTSCASTSSSSSARSCGA